MKTLTQKTIHSSIPNVQYSTTEAYKVARTNLDFSILKDGCKTVVITSPRASEGKSTTSVNIAISLAQRVDVKVLLIDCDLRKPKMHRFFGLKNTPGLTNYLGKQCTKESIIQKTDYPHLSLICSGVFVPNTSELLACDAMANLLSELETEYDYIIIDTPPINLVIDAMPLAKLADGVVLIVREGVSTHTELQRAIESLKWANAKIVGIILNASKQDNKGSYNHYYYNQSRYE